MLKSTTKLALGPTEGGNEGCAVQAKILFKALVDGVLENRTLLRYKNCVSVTIVCCADEVPGSHQYMLLSLSLKTSGLELFASPRSSINRKVKSSFHMSQRRKLYHLFTSSHLQQQWQQFKYFFRRPQIDFPGKHAVYFTFHQGSFFSSILQWLRNGEIALVSHRIAAFALSEIRRGLSSTGGPHLS